MSGSAGPPAPPRCPHLPAPTPQLPGPLPPTLLLPGPLPPTPLLREDAQPVVPRMAQHGAPTQADERVQPHRLAACRENTGAVGGGFWRLEALGAAGSALACVGSSVGWSHYLGRSRTAPVPSIRSVVS